MGYILFMKKIILLLIPFIICINCTNLDNLDKYREPGIFVSINRGGGSGDGSMEHPYRRIQDGVSAAVTRNLKNVYVEEGVYTLTNNGLLNNTNGIDLQISNISLSGGWKKYGDYYYAYQTGETVLDGTGTVSCGINIGDNAYYLSNIIINKFTIKNFSGNSGVSINRLNTGIISNCIISNNSTTANGGGMWISESSYIEIRNCNVRNNSGPGSWGGGIYIYSGGYNIIDNKTVVAYNTVGTGGRGGGICLDTTNYNYIYCMVSKNSSDICAGIYLDTSRFNTISSIIEGNTASSNGGGIFFENNSNDNILKNSTIINNMANSGSGINIDSSSNISIINNYLKNNIGNNTIYITSYNSSSNLTINGNLFYGNGFNYGIFIPTSFTSVNYLFMNNYFKYGSFSTNYHDSSFDLNTESQLNTTSQTGATVASGNVVY
jgi:parallel beta-helix repeat protein